MILADTSIWIDHLRGRTASLAEALNRSAVFTHPFVIGELACGVMHNRTAVVTLLRKLPAVPRANDREAMEFLERRRLMGRGIGYIDVHLLAGVALSGGVRLWTRDSRLQEVAFELNLAYSPL